MNERKLLVWMIRGCYILAPLGMLLSAYRGSVFGIALHSYWFGHFMATLCPLDRDEVLGGIKDEVG